MTNKKHTSSLIIARNVKVYMILAGFGLAAILAGCEDTIAPNNIDPIENTTHNNIKFEILDMSDLKSKCSEIEKAGKNQKDTISLVVRGNIGFDAQNIQFIKRIFGDLKKRGNFYVDWSNPSQRVSSASKLRSATNDDYYTYPQGDVFISTFEEYAEDMGGVPLQQNPETGETVITTETAAAQMLESGNVDSASITTFDSPELVIYDEPSLLANTAFALAVAQDDNKKISVRLGQQIYDNPETFSSARASSHIAGNNDIRGIKISDGRSFPLLQALKGNENISLIDANIICAKDTVNATARSFDNLEVYSEGKYNNGKFFRIIGANGAADPALRGKFNNAGIFYKTDTLSYGNNGDDLSFIIPERLILNNPTADAKGLLKLKDFHYGNIMMQTAGKSILRNHNDSTLAMVSTALSENTGIFQIPDIRPVFSAIYSVETGQLESGGEIDITKLDFNTGNFSGNKLAEGRIGQKLALDADTLKINLPTKYVSYDALKAIIRNVNFFIRHGGNINQIDYPVFVLDGAKYSIVNISNDQKVHYEEITGIGNLNNVSSVNGDYPQGFHILNRDQMKYITVRSDSIPMDSIYHSADEFLLRPCFVNRNVKSY
ncbi:MAG: hypothetical protein LBJ18_00245 [Rickettsiales bacterium]|jgi:hypothetical protein|nr:hypothetical protein [Rickettsiales bacterium]